MLMLHVAEGRWLAREGVMLMLHGEKDSGPVTLPLENLPPPPPACPMPMQTASLALTATARPWAFTR